MKIYRFQVKIVDDKIGFKSEAHREMWRRFLHQFNEKDVTVEVFEQKTKRSERQNRYYWLYLSIIAKETGHTIEELHALFKGKFLTQTITEVMGDKVRITKSSAELTVGEFCEYLADISGFTGCELPDTTEYFGYSYHK